MGDDPLSSPSCNVTKLDNLTCSGGACLSAALKWPVELPSAAIPYSPPSDAEEPSSMLEESDGAGKEPVGLNETSQVADDLSVTCTQYPCPDEQDDDSESWRHIIMALLGAGSYLLFNTGAGKRLSPGQILLVKMV